MTKREKNELRVLLESGVLNIHEPFPAALLTIKALGISKHIAQILFDYMQEQYQVDTSSKVSSIDRGTWRGIKI